MKDKCISPPRMCACNNTLFMQNPVPCLSQMDTKFTSKSSLILLFKS